MRYKPEFITEMIRMVNEEASKPLNDWELGFMESITDQWERDGYLTDPQEEKLEKIYANKTS